MADPTSSIVERNPIILTRIRQLARQNLTRAEIHAKLIEEGHTLVWETFRKAIRKYGIVVRHAAGQGERKVVQLAKLPAYIR